MISLKVRESRETTSAFPTLGNPFPGESRETTSAFPREGHLPLQGLCFPSLAFVTGERKGAKAHPPFLPLTVTIATGD